MKIVLTDTTSGSQIIVESDLIRLIEPSGSGSHIVFASDHGRVVKESVASISTLIGVSVPVVSPNG